MSTGQASATPGTAGTAPVAFGTARYPHVTTMLRRVLPPQRDLRILDLACGHGTLLQCAKALGYTQLAGVDLSAEQVSLAHRAGLAQVQCQELLPFLQAHLQAYDVVFAMDVLEHLTPPELLAALDAVSAALAPGGMLVVHVPNAEGIFGVRIRYGDLMHETAFTATSINQLLRATGFTDIRCQEDRPHMHGITSAVRHVLWRALTAPARLLLAAETGTLRHLLSQNILVVARNSDVLPAGSTAAGAGTAAQG